MITGELSSKVDRIWNTMWSGGISNPLSIIEQLTYLLFIKRLDELHTLKEHKANRTGKPIEEPAFAADQNLESGVIGRFNDAVCCVHAISNRLLDQNVHRPPYTDLCYGCVVPLGVEIIVPSGNSRSRSSSMSC